MSSQLYPGSLRSIPSVMEEPELEEETEIQLPARRSSASQARRSSLEAYERSLDQQWISRVRRNDSMSQSEYARIQKVLREERRHSNPESMKQIRQIPTKTQVAAASIHDINELPDQKWTSQIQAHDTLKAFRKPAPRIAEIFAPLSEDDEHPIVEVDDDDHKSSSHPPQSDNLSPVGSSISSSASSLSGWNVGAGSRAGVHLDSSLPTLEEEPMPKLDVGDSQLKDMHWASKIVNGDTLKQFKKPPKMDAFMFSPPEEVASTSQPARSAAGKQSTRHHATVARQSSAKQLSDIALEEGEEEEEGENDMDVNKDDDDDDDDDEDDEEVEEDDVVPPAWGRSPAALFEVTEEDEMNTSQGDLEEPSMPNRRRRLSDLQDVQFSRKIKRNDTLSQWDFQRNDYLEQILKLLPQSDQPIADIVEEAEETLSRAHSRNPSTFSATSNAPSLPREGGASASGRGGRPRGHVRARSAQLPSSQQQQQHPASSQYLFVVQSSLAPPVSSLNHVRQGSAASSLYGSEMTEASSLSMSGSGHSNGSSGGNRSNRHRRAVSSFTVSQSQLGSPMLPTFGNGGNSAVDASAAGSQHRRQRSNVSNMSADCAQFVHETEHPAKGSAESDMRTLLTLLFKTVHQLSKSGQLTSAEKGLIKDKVIAYNASLIEAAEKYISDSDKPSFVTALLASVGRPSSSSSRAPSHEQPMKDSKQAYADETAVQRELSARYIDNARQLFEQIDADADGCISEGELWFLLERCRQQGKWEPERVPALTSSVAPGLSLASVGSKPGARHVRSLSSSLQSRVMGVAHKQDDGSVRFDDFLRTCLELNMDLLA